MCRGRPRWIGSGQSLDTVSGASDLEGELTSCKRGPGVLVRAICNVKAAYIAGDREKDEDNQSMGEGVS